MILWNRILRIVLRCPSGEGMESQDLGILRMVLGYIPVVGGILVLGCPNGGGMESTDTISWGCPNGGYPGDVPIVGKSQYPGMIPMMAELHHTFIIPTETCQLHVCHSNSFFHFH